VAEKLISLYRRFKARIDARLAQQGKLGAALIKGVAGTASIKAAHALIVFVSSIVIARSLGPAGYGVMTYVIALVHLLSTPSELGVPNLAVREIAVANARKDWGRMRGFIRWANATIGVMSVVVACGGAVALLYLGDELEPAKRTCMWLGTLLVPLASLNALRSALLRGLRKVLLGQLPEQIIRPLAFLLLIVVITIFGNGLTSPVVALVAHIASVVIAFGCGMLLFFRHRPRELAGATPQVTGRRWLASSVPFGLTALMQLINGKTDILILGMFWSDSDVGIYRVAVQIGLLVVFGLQVVNAIQGPHIAHLFAKGDMPRLQKMITRSAQAIFAFALAAVLVIVLFGRFLIETLFNPAFSDAYVPLVIICIGQLVNATIGSVGSLLNMTGHEKDTMTSVVIGATINVALNFALTPIWGPVGAAVATTITLITWNMILWYKVRKRIGIEPSPFMFLLRRR
jgi:O-antigen/teichoic acid export membrane protein